MFHIGKADAFIFDCDGTLIDSLGAWERAERDLFEQAGELTPEQEDEIHSAPIGQAAEIFHTRYGVGTSAQEVLAHLDGHLLDFYAHECRALPGACDFVRSIHDAGLPLVVLSSSPRRYLAAGLARIGILDCFTELVTTDESACSKQDFAIYERALSLLGSPRERTWAVDDAPYAIEVMRRFGLNTIAVGNGCDGHRASRLKSSATLYVDTLAECVSPSS